LYARDTAGLNDVAIPESIVGSLGSS
jgi:hypothetical protein